MAGKAVALRDTYPALSNTDIMDALQENMGSGDISVWDLEQIKIPGGGGIAWEITDADGEPQPHKTFDAIIVMARDTRSYWRLGLDEAEQSGPPDCSSNDAKVGVGNPGGPCATCPMAQFGSAKRGNGQACSLRKQLFLLMPGQVMPAVLSLPPTSLKAARKYLMRLAQQGIGMTSTVTTFGLEKMSNGSNDYSVVTLKAADRLPDADTTAVRSLSAGLKPMFNSAPAVNTNAVRRDVVDPEDDPEAYSDGGDPYGN